MININTLTHTIYNCAKTDSLHHSYFQIEGEILESVKYNKLSE